MYGPGRQSSRRLAVSEWGTAVDDQYEGKGSKRRKEKREEENNRWNSGTNQPTMGVGRGGGVRAVSGFDFLTGA